MTKPGDPPMIQDMGPSERIRLVGGQFTLVSKPGEGTRISATVPLDQETSASTA